MSYTLIRECTVVLFYNGKGYRFDALSNFQFSQTFSRDTVSRKTLHSRQPNPVATVGTKPPGTYSMTVLATDTYSESVLFELAGLETTAGLHFAFPKALQREPNRCDIFVINENNTFHIKDAYLQNVDVLFSIEAPLSFEVAFTASDISRSTQLPLASGLIPQGNPVKPSPVQMYMGNRLYSNIVNAATSFQQVVEWRRDRGIHDMGQIYRSRVATLTDASFTASLTTHLNKDIITPDEPFMTDLRLSQSSLIYELRNVLAVKRFTPEDVFQESFDISLTNETESVIVEYGGLLT